MLRIQVYETDNCVTFFRDYILSPADGAFTCTEEYLEDWIGHYYPEKKQEILDALSSRNYFSFQK